MECVKGMRECNAGMERGNGTRDVTREWYALMESVNGKR